MRVVFRDVYSEALTIVPDAKELSSTDNYYIVTCPNSVGYFPCSTYRFLGLDTAFPSQRRRDL